jgi:N-acyl-D-amino-acid deacylase
LKDPETKRKIREILDINMSSIVAEHTWDRALILTASDEDQDLIGKTIAEAARIRKMEPVDLYLNRLIEGKPLGGHAQAFSEDDVRKLLKHHLSMVSTDGVAMSARIKKKTHPRSFGTYPKILSKYVREERLMPLEEAVRKMSSAPANKLGLVDRGLLRPGFWADIVIFDPLNIRETATYNHPTSFPIGIEAVFVNGVLTVEKGKHTRATAGKALRHRSAED